MTRTTTCDCGRVSIRYIRDWESYDQPYRLPLGWRWGKGRLDAPICPDCQGVSEAEKQS